MPIRPPEGPFRESPLAAERQAGFRAAYLRHPFLYAAVPVVAGVAMVYVAPFIQQGAVFTIGIVAVFFGLLFELANLVDAALRVRRRRGRPD